MGRITRRLLDRIARFFGIHESRWLRERDDDRRRLDQIRHALGFPMGMGLDVDDVVLEIRTLQIALLIARKDPKYG